MWGLYTVNIKVCLPDRKVVVYRKCFLFQRSAEAFAENTDYLEFDYKPNIPEGFTEQDVKGLVTVQDRTQKEYFYKKISVRFDVKETE